MTPAKPLMALIPSFPPVPGRGQAGYQASLLGCPRVVLCCPQPAQATPALPVGPSQTQKRRAGDACGQRGGITTMAAQVSSGFVLKHGSSVLHHEHLDSRHFQRGCKSPELCQTHVWWSPCSPASPLASLLGAAMALLQPVCRSWRGGWGAQRHTGAKIGALVNVGRMGVGRESCAEGCLTFKGRRTCVVSVVR